MSNKAVFLDRDGTINVDNDYVHKIEDLEFVSGAVEGLKNILSKDYKLIIITNQSGIGRNYYSKEDYHKLMEEFFSRLEKKGIKIDATYFCPHAPEEGCKCRKPNTKMIDDAVKDNQIDRKRSYFIGDKTSDIKAGKDAGLKTILVKTGKAGKDGKYDVEADFVCKDLLEASKIIN